MKDLLRFGERGANMRRDQIFCRHIITDRAAVICGKAYIAVGENTHEFAARVDNRDTADAVAAHHSFSCGQGRIGGQGDWIDDHAAFAAFDLIDLFDLLLDSEVAMDHPQAPLARQRNRQFALGYCIHRGTDDGNFELQPLVQLDREIHFGGQGLGITWCQQYIIKGKRLFGKAFRHPRFDLGAIGCVVG